jgi:hypothetical protein
MPIFGASHTTLAVATASRLYEPVHLGPCGPRKLMKIAESQDTMGKAREWRGRSFSGAVEAVSLSDPERAWLTE